MSLWQKCCGKLHFMLVLCCLYLVLTSPWVFMARKLPANTSWWNLSHVYLGLLTGCIALIYLLNNLTKGQWRQYFPWLIGDVKPLWFDIRQCFSGKFPMAGGKGLFSIVEGLLMLALLVTGVTGAGWFLTQGTKAALMWRGWHIDSATLFVTLLTVHLICVVSHIRDFFKA